MSEHDTEEKQLSSVPVPLSVQYTPRSVTMHAVTGMELDAVASLNNSIHLTFFGVCFGASITFAIVLTTAEVKSPITFASYVAALIASGVLALYFGVRGVADYRAAKRKLEELKNGK